MDKNKKWCECDESEGHSAGSSIDGKENWVTCNKCGGLTFKSGDRVKGSKKEEAALKKWDLEIKEKLKGMPRNKDGVPILTSEQALGVMGNLVCQTCGTRLVAKNGLGIYCPKCSKLKK